MSRFAHILFIFILGTVGVSGQKAASAFVRYGLNDGRVLAKEYLRPFGEMMAVNMNGGWYNSAGIHKLGGFDVTIVANYGMVPSKYEFFDLEKLSPQLEVFTFDPSSSMTSAPTVSGELLAGQQMPKLMFKQPVGGAVLPPLLPNGADFDAMISPAVQAAVGLPFNTEVMARFMPRVKYDNYGEAMLWGVGLKHSLWDDLPFLNKIPFLRLSLVGAYSSFSSDVYLDALSNTIAQDNTLRVTSDAWMARMLVGADLPVVSFYAGVGYGNAASSFGYKGTFAVGRYENNDFLYVDVKDPFSITYDKAGIDYNAGLRLKLALLTLHADYTFADYQMVTVGLGLSFR